MSQPEFALSRGGVHDPRLDDELAKLDDLFIHPIQEGPFDADLAWAESLDAGEREEMRRELGAALVAAMLTGRWDEYDEAIDAWHATAEVLSDPELTARLMADNDPSEEVPLPRP